MGGLARAPQAPHAPRPGVAVALRERGAPRACRGGRHTFTYRWVIVASLMCSPVAQAFVRAERACPPFTVLAVLAPRSRARRLSPRTFFVPALAMVSSSCSCANRHGSFCCRLPTQASFQSPTPGKRVRFLIWPPRPAACVGRAAAEILDRGPLVGQVARMRPCDTLRYPRRTAGGIEQRARPRQRPLGIRRAS